MHINCPSSLRCNLSYDDNLSYQAYRVSICAGDNWTLRFIPPLFAYNSAKYVAATARDGVWDLMGFGGLIPNRQSNYSALESPCLPLLGAISLNHARACIEGI
jgi:hypothetical protein